LTVKKRGPKMQTTTPIKTRKVEEKITSEKTNYQLTPEIDQEAFF